VIRDIRRKIKGDKSLQAAFLRPLWLAERVRTQKTRDPLVIGNVILPNSGEVKFPTPSW
jgi:hypothetical protein